MIPNMIIDPTVVLKDYIKENSYNCTSNNIYKSLTNSSLYNLIDYIYNYDTGKINNLCDVIITDVTKHSAIINEINFSKKKPLVMFEITDKFDGSNIDKLQGFEDELLLCSKSNINYLMQKSKLYTEDINNKTLYYTNVLLMRDSSNNFMNNPYVYDIATVKRFELNTNDISQHISLLKNIECLFQIAVKNKYDSIILSTFNDMNTNDIIKIFNYCIYLYGHKLKRIYIVVHDNIMLYRKSIINPVNI